MMLYNNLVCCDLEVFYIYLIINLFHLQMMFYILNLVYLYLVVCQIYQINPYIKFQTLYLFFYIFVVKISMINLLVCNYWYFLLQKFLYFCIPIIYLMLLMIFYN